jgi:uncharacterized RDD family membrane protein YckC
MSTIRIATNFNIDLEFPAAPFHSRFLAWIIDLVAWFIYIIAMSKIGQEFASTYGFEDGSFIQAIFYFLIFVPAVTYHLLSELLLNGQSVGKKIMGLRVVNENGGRPSVGQFIMRWIIRTSDFALFVLLLLAIEASDKGGSTRELEFLKHFAAAIGLLLLDVVLVNTSKKRQRLGDMLAHTILIRTKQEGDIHETIFQEVHQDYVPSFPQVMQLSDRDINALKGILDSARRKHDYNMAEVASEKIKNHLNIQASLSAFDFLEILLKDYNYLSSH